MRLPIWIRNGVIALVGLLLMYHAVLYASNLIEEADIVLAPNQTVVVRPTKHVSTPNHNQTPLATNINVQHKEPKFAIMTAIGTGDYQEQIAPFSVNNKKSYCELRGYDLIVVRESMDRARSMAWTKILALLKYLPYYDWIMWIDNDALITNYQVTLESRLVDGSDLVIAADWHGINAGIFIIKNGEWSKEFLTEVYSQKQYIGTEFEEQEAMKILITKEKYRPRVFEISKRMLNSYPNDWHSGDFTFHQPGCIHPTRTIAGCVNSLRDKVSWIRR